MKQSKHVTWRQGALNLIRSGCALTVLAAALTVCSANVNAVDPGTLTSGPRILAHHVPAAVTNGLALRLNPLASSKRLKLAINLPARNQPQLDQLVHDLYDPQSPYFHQYLSVEQFTERFAPTQEDYDAVVAWAKANGLEIVETTPNRRIVNVEGSTDTINRAFNIALNEYQHPTEERTFFASDREPTATGLNVPLLQVVGLDNYVRPYTKLKHASTAVPHLTGSGPSGEYLPSDMRAAYYGSGSLTGAGQSIGIFSFDGYLTSDVTLYYTSTGMTSSVPVNNVLVGGYSGACVDPSTGAAPCDDGEQILDIVNAIGMAPGITQILFYEGSDDTTILNKMATDNTAKVLSCSWGWSPADASSDDPIFQEFAAQGQSFVNATGDSGQFNSSTYYFPSVDQYITQVGGTDLTTTGPGGAWSSETGWADSGGGYYTGTPIPTWQQLTGVITSTNKGSTTLRNAPDVAAEANFDNPTVSNGSFLTGYGGTSFAAPRWAGFLALINQQSVANGNGTVGFVNPAIYNIGVGSSFTSDFHDITSGNNKPTSGSGSGFNAVTGYDLVTGWGSPKAALITALAGGSSGTADFTLSDSPGSLSVAQGSSGTSTITVSDLNGFGGSVSLAASGLPSGVTAAFSPTSTTTTSTLTLTASSTATAGTATVTVTGTSGSLTHTATISLTVTTAGGSSQLLSNTGFETGTASPWTMSSGTLCSNSTCSGETAHAGTWFAWLDGYGSSHTDTVTQSVTIPSGKTSATLAFYLHIDTAETTTSTAYDTLKVQVLNSSGTVLATLATYSNLNAASGYTLHSLNMSSYIGQTVKVQFTGKEDSSLQTSFILDDITLTVL